MSQPMPRSEDPLTGSEHRIESILRKNPYDFESVFKELDSLRTSDPKNFRRDLQAINDELHRQKLLPHLEIIQDDRTDYRNRRERGYAVAAEDGQDPPGTRTMVSTSHHAPQQSARSRRAYRHMHYGHGQYDGWKQSVDGGGGADGGYDRHAIGRDIPRGARKELIDKALQLAGVPVTPSTEAAVNKIVTRESHWNPNITNTWDSNARAGHPSTGLMQTIPSTFRRYALPGLNTNIHDPLSNLVAGIRYAQARYGHHGMSGVEWVARRPGGY